MINNLKTKCPYCNKNLSMIMLKSDGITALELGEWCSNHGVFKRHKRNFFSALWREFILYWNCTVKGVSIKKGKK